MYTSATSDYTKLFSFICVEKINDEAIPSYFQNYRVSFRSKRTYNYARRCYVRVQLENYNIPPASKSWRRTGVLHPATRWSLANLQLWQAHLVRTGRLVTSFLLSWLDSDLVCFYFFLQKLTSLSNFYCFDMTTTCITHTHTQDLLFDRIDAWVDSLRITSIRFQHK